MNSPLSRTFDGGRRAQGERDHVRADARRLGVFNVVVGLVAASFGTLAGLDSTLFGFDRGLHTLEGVALNGWASLGHALLAAVGAHAVIRSGSR